jgi:formyltetrahydrofolate deformylase
MNEVVIHLICPDKKGIIARFTNQLYKNKINIISLEQHVEPDENIFFMRIHANIENMILNKNEFSDFINEFKQKMNAQIYYYDYLKPLNMAILCTKEEGPILELILKQKAGKLNCNIPTIISNHDSLSDLSNRHNIDYYHFPIIDDKTNQETKILNLLNDKKIDLIVLARYMQILSPEFVSKYPNKIINIHHGFLPAFKGSKPYHRAWKKGVKMIGATAHYVTSKLDEGPIIEQDVESVTHHFSINELIETGRDIERKVLLLAVQAHLDHKILIHKKRTIIFH